VTTPRRHINLTTWQSERGGFSQAVGFPAGDGEWLLLSGVGSEGGTGEPEARGDIAEQCRIAWASIGEVLTAAGAGFADIVRVRSYVTDARYLPNVTAARKEAFGSPPYPPHTFLVVSALALPQMLVEIEVDAFVAPRG
jgi:enamine deaminase RidA (YjgF/YER057c/UK114 family)